MDEFQQLRSGEKPLSSRQINILVWTFRREGIFKKIIPLRNLSREDKQEYRRISGTQQEEYFLTDEGNGIPIEISLRVLGALCNPEYDVAA